MAISIFNQNSFWPLKKDFCKGTKWWQEIATAAKMPPPSWCMCRSSSSMNAWRCIRGCSFLTLYNTPASLTQWGPNFHWGAPRWSEFTVGCTPTGWRPKFSAGWIPRTRIFDGVPTNFSNFLGVPTIFSNFLGVPTIFFKFPWGATKCLKFHWGAFRWCSDTGVYVSPVCVGAVGGCFWGTTTSLECFLELPP